MKLDCWRGGVVSASHIDIDQPVAVACLLCFFEKLSGTELSKKQKQKQCMRGSLIAEVYGCASMHY